MTINSPCGGSRTKRSYYVACVLTVIGVFFFIIPIFVHDEFYLNILILAAANGVIALAMRAIMNMGTPSFAHGAFVGIGGYASGLGAIKLGLPFWLTAPFAAVVAVIIAVVLGVITLRLRGTYFIIITLSFSEIIRVVLNSTGENIWGGAKGLLNIPPPSVNLFGRAIQFSQNNLAPYYYLIFVILIITLIVMYRTDHSRIGMNIRALRFSPNLAQSIGIHLMKWRVIAFAIGCIFAAIAGAFYAHYYVMVDANAFFGVSYIIPVIAWVIVGGRESIVGTLLGAAILTILPQYIKPLREYDQMAFGMILVLFGLVLPQGLAGLPLRFSPWWASLRRKEQS